MKLLRSPVFLIFMLVVGVIAVAGFMLFQDSTPPEITIFPEKQYAAPGQKFIVTATDSQSSIRSITVSVRKNSQIQVLRRQVFEDKAQRQDMEFALKNTFLREGGFTLVVNAVDGSFAGFGQGNSSTKEYQMFLDTSPPKVVFKTGRPNVRRGGTGCVVYSVSRDVERTGVRVGDLFFPAYRLDNGDYITFFAFPHDMSREDFHPEVEVTDLADAVTLTRIPVNRLYNSFRKDVVRIDDNFLERKMPEFSTQVPGTASYLELFNKVNGELRRSNAARLRQIGSQSGPEALWTDRFLALPGGAVRAGFGEHRSYLYNGIKQDVEAYHLGLDLASTAQSPVPAGNDGVVIFAGYLGIYGNLVVLDHGLGLQSLYSHLSDISVEEGQRVNRGQTIGRTGVTGMAVGDHLHFGVMVSGVEVSPIEWLDRKWIRDNVVGRLSGAGHSIVNFYEPPAEDPEEGDRPRRRRR